MSSEATWLLPGATKDVQSITAAWELSQRQLIEGVVIRHVKHVPKGNGSLVELYRRDWAVDGLPVDQVFQVTLVPGGISAWHAHQFTTDRLFVSHGLVRVVLYDARDGSSTRGVLNEFKLGTLQPALLVVPPKVWHGVQNIASECATVVNLVDRAYEYEDPDHWRVPEDSPDVPFAW